MMFGLFAGLAESAPCRIANGANSSAAMSVCKCFMDREILLRLLVILFCLSVSWLVPSHDDNFEINIRIPGREYDCCRPKAYFE